jgi:hypothetical protein
MIFVRRNKTARQSQNCHPELAQRGEAPHSCNLRARTRRKRLLQLRVPLRPAADRDDNSARGGAQGYERLTSGGTPSVTATTRAAGATNRTNRWAG